MRAVLALLLVNFLGFGSTSPLESRLDRQLKTWQKRLGMEDWSLTVRVVRQHQLEGDSWGNSEWDDEAKTGTISVLDPRDYNLKGDELKLDMECTIVHELVHIQMAPMAAPDATVREEVVNRIMKALMGRACPN